MKTRVFAVYAVIFLFCGIVNAGINDGLVAYYPFNGNANDESGNGHNGTVTGSGVTLTSDRYVNANQAYAFNNTGGYILANINAANLFNNSDFTISAWVKIDNFTIGWPTILIAENYNIVFQALGADNPSMSKHLAFYQQSSASDVSTRIGTLTSSSALNENQWYLTTVVKCGLQFKMYINSTVSASSSSSGNIPMNGTFITIGSDNTGRSGVSVDGSIDDVRIYNRAISESEIQQLYQGGTCSSEVVKFTAGTPAKAADVNANFDAQNCQIQALKAAFCHEHPTASLCQ